MSKSWETAEELVNFEVMCNPGSMDSTQERCEIEQDQERKFFEKVREKTESKEMDPQDAMDEARVELILDLNDGDAMKSVCYLLTTWPYEIQIPRFVRILLRNHRQPLGTLRDQESNTALHMAASRNLVTVAEFLLEENPEMLMTTNSDMDLPVETALRRCHDDVAAFLVKHMSNRSVLQLFRANKTENARHSFVFLVKQFKMKKTILAVLDAMVVPQWPYPVSLHYHNTLSSEWQTMVDQPTHLDVCFDLIDADKYGRAPDDPSYQFCPKSSFYYITRECQKLNKALIFHPVVKLITERKWTKYGGFWFRFRFLNYLVYLAILSLGMMTMVAYPDMSITPHSTSSWISGTCFLWCFLMVCWFLLDEFAEMKREPRQYFKDWTNYWDVSRNVLMGFTMVVRFQFHEWFWLIASIATFVNTMGIFKYSLVFSLTSSYARALGRVIYKDIPRFTVVFFIVVFSFFLSITIALRGVQPQVFINDLIIGSGFGAENNGLNCTDTGAVCIVTSLVRIWSQGRPILEDNVGFIGYFPTLLVYILSMCVNVVLLNVLIAQLSHTYELVQEESHLSSTAELMHAITTVEFQSRFKVWNLRVKYYTPKETRNIDDIKDHLKAYANALWEEDLTEDRLEQLERKIAHLGRLVSARRQRSPTASTTVM
ncbi:transient receptor potential cation channel subfamily A member 1-like isoform X2 [Nematostella vectensis]|nr:transient receptor potential cation channel subfamily A member 1-like isoform X2 [Nematostella vectensis]